MASLEERMAQEAKDIQVNDAILRGMVKARQAGLSQPYDVALCVQVALKEAGFRIVRTPVVS